MAKKRGRFHVNMKQALLQNLEVKKNKKKEDLKIREEIACIESKSAVPVSENLDRS